jgi:hypothetical protein
MPKINYAQQYESIQGVEAQLHIFTTCIECPFSHPGRFLPTQNVSCTSWVRGWVVPRIGLEGLEKWKKSCLRLELNPDPHVVQPVVQSRYRPNYRCIWFVISME